MLEILLKQSKCCSDLIQYEVPDTIYTLTAAYAASGKFDRAIETAQKAIDMARSADREDLADKIKERQELYRKSRGYYEGGPGKN